MAPSWRRTALAAAVTATLAVSLFLLPERFTAIATASLLGGLLAVSALRPDESSPRRLTRTERTGESAKVLDTSVLIDGRAADVAEAGFLDGDLILPEFILRELQAVADSPDAHKRARGRRGLDVMQRLQKVPSIRVRIVNEDFPQIRDVDSKLLELAQRHRWKVITNDFNLNKVAHVRGVPVLNINELAQALRPVVLPGESMRVFVAKEGKEPTQGIAYLDDGTMVVVDNARRMISKTIDITVTSVLQTTAGKMIFGRFDERHHGVHSPAERPSAGAQGA